MELLKDEDLEWFGDLSPFTEKQYEYLINRMKKNKKAITTSTRRSAVHFLLGTKEKLFTSN